MRVIRALAFEDLSEIIFAVLQLISCNSTHSATGGGKLSKFPANLHILTGKLVCHRGSPHCQNGHSPLFSSC